MAGPSCPDPLLAVGLGHSGRQTLLHQSQILKRCGNWLAQPMISYVFHMISYVFHMILYVFHMLLYGFYMILYGFYMILLWFLYDFWGCDLNFRMTRFFEF